MNPFLKKEWKDLDFPEKTYLRARSRAWEKLKESGSAQSKFPWRKVGMAFASLSVTLAVLFLAGKWNYLEPHQEMAEIQQDKDLENQPTSTIEPEIKGMKSLGESPKLQNPSHGIQTVRREPESQTNEQPVDSPVKASYALTFENIQIPKYSSDLEPRLAIDQNDNQPVNVDITDEAQQLVMHFQLPETGIRMIWVKDDLTKLED